MDIPATPKKGFAIPPREEILRHIRTHKNQCNYSINTFYDIIQHIDANSADVCGLCASIYCLSDKAAFKDDITYDLIGEDKRIYDLLLDEPHCNLDAETFGHHSSHSRKRMDELTDELMKYNIICLKQPEH